MSHKGDGDLLPDEESLNPKDNSADMDSTGSMERILEALIEDKVIPTRILLTSQGEEPLEEATSIGSRVQANVLQRLGKATLGAYIKFERERKNLDKQAIASQLGLAVTSLTDIEQDRYDFSNLAISKAADFVEVIGLNASVVVQYIQTAILPTPPQGLGEVSRLYRTRAKPSEEKRPLPKATAQQEDIGTDNLPQQREKFIEEFLNEVRRRGLAKSEG